MTTLLMILSNKYVKYGLAVVAALLILNAARLHYIHQGKDEGHEEEKHNTQAVVEDARKAERATAVAQISAKDAEANAAGARADAAEGVAAQFADLNRLLITQRAAVAGKVNATPDSDLHAGITTTLGLRPANDTTPGYYPSEERSLYTCALERPLCTKSNDALAKEVAEHTAAIADLRTQVAAKDAKYDALAGYAVQLEGAYTTAINLFPKKERAKKCLWLYSCGAKKLTLPNPEELKARKPK